MRPLTVAALAILATACCYAKPPAVPQLPPVPTKVELVDAQEMRIANLQLQVAEQQAAMVQAQVELARAARGKVAAKLADKYHLDVAAGDDFDGATLAIKRPPRKVTAPAPSQPAVPPPPNHTTPAPRAPLYPPKPPGK